MVSSPSVAADPKRVPVVRFVLPAHLQYDLLTCRRDVASLSSQQRWALGCSETGPQGSTDSQDSF